LGTCLIIRKEYALLVRNVTSGRAFPRFDLHKVVKYMSTLLPQLQAGEWVG